MNRVILLAAVAIVLLVTPSAVPGAVRQTNLKKGAELFAWKCAKCHGSEAVGADPKNPYGGWKDNGTRIPPALNGTAHSWNHSNRELFAFIKNGSIDRSSSMRSHKGLISDYGIICIMQYIKSLWPEEIRKKHHELFGEGQNSSGSP